MNRNYVSVTLCIARILYCATVRASGVNASSRLGGRTTEWGGVWEGNTPPHTSPPSVVRWEGSGQPILVCYIRKCVIILGDIPVDVPQPKYWGDVSPASPAGLTPVVRASRRVQNNTYTPLFFVVAHFSREAEHFVFTDSFASVCARSLQVVMHVLLMFCT